MNLRLVFMILALVCFVLAALEVQTPRINVTGAGLAFAALAWLVT